MGCADMVALVWPEILTLFEVIEADAGFPVADIDVDEVLIDPAGAEISKTLMNATELGVITLPLLLGRIIE